MCGCFFHEVFRHLSRIRRYASGETICVSARDERKARGETAGCQRYIREKNEEIRAGFANGPPF